MKKIIQINIKKIDFDYPNYNTYRKKFDIYFREDKKKIDKKKVVAIIAGLEKFEKKEIDNYPNLKIISRFGTGVDNIDLDYVKKKRILLLKTMYEPVLPTAELTVALILMITRKLFQNISSLKNKKWFQFKGQDLKPKELV